MILPASAQSLHRLAVRTIAVTAAAALLPAHAAAPPAKCPDMLVSANDLGQILDQSLGDFRSLVDQRSVVIDPADNACYLHFTLSSSALPQLGGASCSLRGCASVLYKQQNVALTPFDVAGCEGVFDLLGLPRHVNSTYVDASAWVQQQCGSLNSEIAGVAVVQAGGESKLRISFKPTAPGAAK